MLKIAARLMVLFTFLVASCVTTSCNHAFWDGGPIGATALPRTSFVKIEKIIKLKVCSAEEPENCFTKTLVSSGSGFVVKNDEDGSFIFTAGHVCDDSDVIKRFKRPNVTVLKTQFVVIDISNKRYNAKTIVFTMCEDMCVAYAPGLHRPAADIAKVSPHPGAQVFNLAAPLGVFEKNMIPILHGHYSGRAYGGKALYTIPAIGGSSGSPVFNRRGEVVGMIHSVHYRFHHLAISPTHEEIQDYILKYANRKTLLENLVK